MMLLPGVGEPSITPTLRIGLAVGLAILLVPSVQADVPLLLGDSASFALVIAANVFTGLWFGWLARQIALVLPVMAQVASYLVGLASVLQPDAELGAQTTALGRLFEAATPLLFLVTGLYQTPLLALRDLFVLIPPAQMLPMADGVQSAVTAVGTSFALATQLAAPFFLVGLLWQCAMGLLARLVARMQIYFVSVPGQILGGIVTLVLVSKAILIAWQDSVGTLLHALPGTG
ncbi:MAG: flagellar biosynthetic protein FliR [Rhodospirillales bacterium]|nr:flagellar biosynthetic protein FliR [Acetobacter sp.]